MNTCTIQHTHAYLRVREIRRNPSQSETRNAGYDVKGPPNDDTWRQNAHRQQVTKRTGTKSLAHHEADNMGTNFAQCSTRKTNVI